MIYATRLGLSRTDKGETCYELNVGKHLLNIGLDSDSVLNQYHNRILMEQRRE